MKESAQPITDALKAAISKSGIPHIALERGTGVNRVSIMRFMRGERSLRLDKADMLATFFRLEMTPQQKNG